MKWFYNLKRNDQKCITFFSWFISVLLIIFIDYDITLLVLFAIAFVIFTIYITYLYNKAGKDNQYRDYIPPKNKIDEENNKNNVTKTSSYVSVDKIKYDQLKMNDFTVNKECSNFYCNLKIALLNQIKTNSCFNENDFSFNIDDRINELKKIAFDKICHTNKGNFIAVDLETTGLKKYDDEKNDRIIQIAAIKVENFEIVGVYTTYVNPEKQISSKASEINGITNEMLINEPTIKEVFPDFIKFIGNQPLIMHNADFDYTFLQNEYQRVYKQDFTRKTICTMKLWRNKFYEIQKEMPESAKLKDIAYVLLDKDEYEKYIKNQHDAIADATATALIYIKMI